MPTIGSLSDLAIDALVATGPDPRSGCECSHSQRPDGQCDRPVSVRVTVVCAADGCDCAAGVYLLCQECLSVWKKNARRHGVRLRVKQL